MAGSYLQFGDSAPIDDARSGAMLHGGSGQSTDCIDALTQLKTIPGPSWIPASSEATTQERESLQSVHT